MWNKTGFGLIVLILVSFVYAYFDGKGGQTNNNEYTTLNKDFIGYDSASVIATKSLFFINIRTPEDYKKLEKEKEFISDVLYKDYLLGKSYAGTYKKDNIDLLSIQGQDIGSGQYIFKLTITTNGVKNKLIVLVDNNIIKEIRSLGDV